jgi:hypothetical protein
VKKIDLQFVKSIDLQDVLFVLGIVFVVLGVAAWSRPAASIVLGVACLLCVRFIARARSHAEQKQQRGQI